MELLTKGMTAPFQRSVMTTEHIILCVILALFPAGIHGVFRFGLHAGLLILVSCGASVATEYIYQKIAKRPVTVKQCRGLLMGLLMAYCLPPGLSLYLGALAGAVCALFMELSLQFFKRNVVSPVILARLLMSLAFQAEMSVYPLDGLTMATPMAVLKEEGTVNVLYMILGKTGGCIGETSALWLCVGAMFLIMVGIMDFRVAGMYLFSFAAFLAIFGGHGLSSYYLSAQLAGGGFMLALWFIAPAYSSLPITKGGRWFYGIVLGIFSGFFRLFGPSAENLCIAILLANLCVPLLEKITIRHPFGVEKERL